MYYWLTREIKGRIIDALKESFQNNPRHDDIVDHIQEKYEFSNRPQEAIVLQGASVNSNPLSADNFLGNKYSYVSVADVDDYPGHALEWVREDTMAIDNNGGEMPSDSGVYFIRINETTQSGDCPEFEFYVDPMQSVEGEKLIEFNTGNESSATLLNAPFIGGTLDLYLESGSMLLSGKGLKLEADESLKIEQGDNDDLLLGFDGGYVSPSVTGSNTEDFTVTSSNNVLSLKINGKLLKTTFSTGTLNVSDIKDAIENEVSSASNIGSSEIEIENDNGAVKITTTEKLEFDVDSISTANDLLGFEEGYVGPSKEGRLVRPYIPDGTGFKVIVDGTTYDFSFDNTGNMSVAAISQMISSETSASSLSISTVDAGDYKVDSQTGTVTFLHDFYKDQVIRSDYRYPLSTKGPFDIGSGKVSNNTAIPGVVLAFGDDLIDGDAQAVVVEENRAQVADIYGGKFDVSIDIDIYARDSMTRSELADSAFMYLWQTQRAKLANEGIIINDVSHGGESQEPYDENADDYFYLASLSVSLMTDWELYYERTLKITRVVPHSYRQDSLMSEDKDNLGKYDLLTFDDDQLESDSRVYIRKPDKDDIERVV